MYSKALNNKDMRMDVYRRPSPAPPHESIRLPINYKGTAFNPDGSSRTYISQTAQEDDGDAPMPTESELQPPPPEAPKDTAAPSPLADALSRLGSMVSTKGFPFGHGIGFEELLLIGLLLFIADGDENCECTGGERDITRLILTALLLCG